MKSSQKPIICSGCGKWFPNLGASGRHGQYDKSCTPTMRFWGKVDKSSGPAACWPWMGAVTTHGYGNLKFMAHYQGAHKVSYRLTKGEVPAGMEVMHSCDNPPCCNPAHLSLGTKKDNAQQKIARKRHPLVGTKRLKADDVKIIRSLRGKSTSGEIAVQFNITQSYVFTIWGRKVWRGI